MSTRRTTLKPSDVVTWRERKLGVWTLHTTNERTVFGDRQTGDTLADGSWRARLLYTGDDPFGALDPDDTRWELETQGAHSGGRRYRGGFTFADAQRVALAWLDRRFRLPRYGVGVEDEEPLPREGVDRCACGSKYWDGDRCIDCGDRWPACAEVS